VQQHKNLQLIVASQVDQLWQHVVTHSSPVCLHQQTTVAKYPLHRSRGGRRTEDFLAMDAALWMCHCVSMVPRPRLRPRLEGSKTKTMTQRFKTKTETKTCKNGSRDASRARLKSQELQVWFVMLKSVAKSTAFTLLQCFSLSLLLCLLDICCTCYVLIWSFA